MFNKKNKIIILFTLLIVTSSSFISVLSKDRSPLENNSLIAYWSLDEGAGSIAHDFSGNNLDGIIHGPTWTNGYSGYALNFDGDLDYILLDEHTDELGFNKTDDYKISAWIKTDSSTAGVIYMINGSTELSTTYIPFFYIKLKENGIIEMKVKATEYCEITLDSSNSYNDGIWHFIEGIYHGSEGYPELELYVDNEFVAIGSDWLCDMENKDFTNAKIGMTSYNSLDSFQGLIDEIKIYKRPNQNNPPNIPQISGPTSGKTGATYSYTFNTTDIEGDQIYLWVDWGDNISTGWLGLYNSNENIILSHSWSEKDIYEIKARARDTYDVGEWGLLTVQIDDENGISTNESLIADASLSETKGTVGIPISLDGSKSSDSKGIITGYRWDFTSDGIYDTNWSTNPKTKYIYNSEGIFKVTLQVKNNNDSIDEDQINITISKKINNSPTKPIITGKSIGTQNTKIYFTIVSTDSDNDYLKYNISWGDLQKTSSEYFLSGTAANINHKWINAGIYNITAYAFDNKTISEKTSFIILIDAYYVKKIGYLLDTNSDGTCDIFHYNDTSIETITEKTKNGYYIDYDDDGKWDYIFNLPADLLSQYFEENNSKETSGFEIILIIFAITLITLWKRKKQI